MCTSWDELLDDLETYGAWNKDTQDWDPQGLSWNGKRLIAFIRRHLNEETK